MRWKVDAETVGALLARAHNDYPQVDSLTRQVLLAYVIKKDRAWLPAHPEARLTPAQCDHYQGLLARAAQGEPLAYLTGVREFHGLRFAVTPQVLIPRPETEDLIDDVIAWIKSDPPQVNLTPRPPLRKQRGGDTSLENTIPFQIVDVGTGSGAIAITLAVKLAQVQITAVDISPAALAIAEQNASRHGVTGRVHFVAGDLLEDLPGPFEVIIANLPYIASGVLAELAVSRHEPAQALDGGADGLDLIRRLVAQSPARLAAGGLLALEIGYDQGEAVRQLCEQTFPAARVEVRRDLAGLDRRVLVTDKHRPCF